MASTIEIDLDLREGPQASYIPMKDISRIDQINRVAGDKKINYRLW